jgi:hypothetical protein
MKKLLALFALVPTFAFAQVSIPVTNDATTGTIINETAVINSVGNAITATTSQTSVPTFIVTGVPGTKAQAQLAVIGQASCVMDTTIASGASQYYVVNSTTIAGYCHPQASPPAAGVWVLGFLSPQFTATGVASIVNINSFPYP